MIKFYHKIKLILIVTILFSAKFSLAQFYDPQEKSKSLQDKDVVQAGDIYDSCRKQFDDNFKTIEAIARKSACNGFFMGVGGTIILLEDKYRENKCLPENISTEKLIKIYIKWIENNTERLAEPAHISVLESIEDEFLCKKNINN